MTERKNHSRRMRSSTTRSPAATAASTTIAVGLILVISLQQQVNASRLNAYSAATQFAPSSYKDFLGGESWRGGATSNGDDGSNDEDDTPKRRQRKKFWNLASLFELNMEAQENALEEGDEMEPLPPGNGRGGALAMVKAKPRRFLQIYKPPVEEPLPVVEIEDGLVDSKSPMRRFLQLKEEPPPPQVVETTAPEDDTPVAAAAAAAEETTTIAVEEEVSEEEEEVSSPEVAVASEEEEEVSEEASESNNDDDDDDEPIEEEESPQQVAATIDTATVDTNGVMGLWWTNAWTSAMSDVAEQQQQKEEEMLAATNSNDGNVHVEVDKVAQEVEGTVVVEEDEQAALVIEQQEEERQELVIEEQTTEIPAAVEEELPLSIEREEEEETVASTVVTESTSTVETKVEVKAKKKSPVDDYIPPGPPETTTATVGEPPQRKKKKKKKKKTKVVAVVVEEAVGVVTVEEPELPQSEEETQVEVVELVVDDDEDESLDDDLDFGPAIVIGESPFISSGAWATIDAVVSLGLASNNPSLRLSRHMRSFRKATARATGMHGFLSGKEEDESGPKSLDEEEEPITLDEEDLGQIRRRIAAIDRARKSVELKQEEAVAPNDGRRLFRRRRKQRLAEKAAIEAKTVTPEIAVEIIKPDEIDKDEEGIAAQRRKERVKEIDRQISQASDRLNELKCEKDALQQRPNPLYNYTTTPVRDGELYKFSREFIFPPDSLVEDYLDDMFANGRLIRMNHTQLWQSGFDDDDEDESIGDDLLTPSADASKLYEQDRRKSHQSKSKKSHANGGGGSWLLRQSIGKGGSLGEKIGEATECSGYRAVCAAVMSSLARSIAAIHGTNIMTHSDIRLFVEQVPDLPPIGRNSLPQSHYAQEAIKGAMMKGRGKRRKKAKLSEEAFLQRDAVVETLLSHCQISAPLLKLFPLAWQRALLANMITLITHVISDFCDGIELQILGHSLTFSFKPITESDMIRHIGLAGKGLNHRRARPEEFEAAVRATAEDVSASLKFLDRWHERALGSGMLRAQIANLIARIVLTLADEVLSGARMDLWAAQAGGPRVVAGLEYRTTPSLPTVEEDE